MCCDERKFEQSNLYQNMDYNALLFRLTIWTLLGLSQAKRAYIVELKKLSCVINDPVFIGNATCIIHKRRSNPTASVHIFLKETMRKPIVQIYVDILKKDKSKANIGHVHLDACKLLGSFYNDRYGMFFKRILSVGTFPKKCPVQGNHFYSINNYTFLVDDFPPAAPAVTFQVLIKISKPNNSSVVDVMVEAAFIY